MLRVESSDFLSYTEFEEEILFDEDDPDFARQDVMPTISLPLVLRGIIFLIYASYYLRFSVTSSYDVIAYYGSVVNCFLFASTSVIALVIFGKDYWKFMQVKKMIDYVDNELKKINITTDYKLVTLVGSGITSLSPVVVLVLVYASDREALIKLYDGMLYYYPFYIRLAFMVLFLLVLWVVLDRFHKINQYIESMEEEQERKPTKLYNRSSEFLLNKIIELHMELVNATKLWNDYYSLVLLLSIFDSFTQALFGLFDALFVNSSIYSPFELYISVVALTIEMGIVYITCFYIENEQISTFSTYIQVLAAYKRRRNANIGNNNNS